MILHVSTITTVLLAAGLAQLKPVHAESSNGLQAADSFNKRSSDSVSSSFSRKRRHANLSKHARSDKRQLGSLFQATGFGTLYYDVNGGGTCGPVNGWYSYPETQGYTACEPWQNPKTIAQRGSNRIVAIPSNMLNGNTAKYCGKAVSVTWNGNTINDLIVWDGCASCNSDNGIDFSSTIFGELVSEKNCGMGRVNGVTWKILDKQIWDTNGNPVSGNDGGDGGEDKPDPKPQPEPKPTTTSTKARPTSTTSSSSSSLTKVVETPSSTPKPTTSSKASSSEDDTSSTSSTSTKVTPSKSPEKPVEVEPTTTSSPAFTPTSLSSIFSISSTLSPSFSQGVPHHNGAGKPPSSNSASSSTTDDEPSAQPSATVAPAPPATAPSVSPSAPEEVDPSYDESGLPTCSNPGQWRCNDKNGLEQCISRLDGKGWIWFLRLNCGSSQPLNCDTANPVCPNGVKKRTCPAKVSKL